MQTDYVEDSRLDVRTHNARSSQPNDAMQTSQLQFQLALWATILSASAFGQTPTLGPSSIAQAPARIVWEFPGEPSPSIFKEGLLLHHSSDQLIEVTSTFGAFELKALDEADLSPLWVSPLPAGTRVWDMDELPNGDIVVVGSVMSSGAIPSPIGGFDAFAAIYGSGGQLVNAWRFGGTADNWAVSVSALPSGDLVIAGFTDNDGYGGANSPMEPAPFLARSDAQGGSQWVERVENGTDYLEIIDIDAAPGGAIYAAGFRVASNFAPKDRMIIEADASGQNQTFTFGDVGEFESVVALADGSAVFAGYSWDSASGVQGGVIRRVAGSAPIPGWTLLIPGLSGAYSEVFAVVPDGSGGIWASVKDASSVLLSFPAFTGVIQIDSRGREVRRSQLFTVWDRIDGFARGNDGDFFLYVRPVFVMAPLVIRLTVGSVAATVCDGAPNSTGAGAVLDAAGSAEASANRLTLFASGLPPQQAVLFLTSRTAGSSIQLPNTQGVLCLDGSIGRFVAPGQVQMSGVNGLAHLDLALNALALPSGSVPALAGES